MKLPEPKIEECGMRLRFTIYLGKPHRVSAEAMGAPGVESGGESGGESEMTARVLALLKTANCSKREIAQGLGKAKPNRYLDDLMTRLLREGYVEYLIPDKPNSRLQKYRLTRKGKRAVEKKE